MAAPVNQGTLNRVRANISFNDFSSLNIIPAYLGKEGITGAAEGEIVKMLPTMTGFATSPEPCMLYKFSADVMRTNGLGNRFKQQIENLSTLGTAVIRSDSTQFDDMTIFNCAIVGCDPIKLNGEQVGWMLHFAGTWLINQNMYNL